MIVLIDNYDSFVYNLYQLLGSLDPNVVVYRNDTISTEELASLNPNAIVLSPGPGKPADAGICVEVVQRLSGTIPLLGVCLGHQAICEAFGAVVGHAKHLMHGKSSPANLDTTSPLFKDLPHTISVARYHSLAADEETLPADLHVIAHAQDEVMAVAHRLHPTYGVQFHPESILTPDGRQILQNFLDVAAQFNTAARFGTTTRFGTATQFNSEAQFSNPVQFNKKEISHD